MKITSPNKGFLFPAILFFIILGILLICTEQGAGLHFFSDNRSDFWNTFFIYGTQLGEEPVYIILTILGVFISWKFAVKIPLIGLTIMGLSYFLKGIFLHKRPFQYYGELQQMEQFNLVEGVHVLIGYSSFPSGHTMSGFGLFYLLSLHFNKNVWMGVICFLCAMIVGVSRIYLFEHFIKDVLVGGMIGVLVAQLMDYLFTYKKTTPIAATT